MHEETLDPGKGRVTQVTTASGSVYQIDFDSGQWCKNSWDRHDALREFKVGHRDRAPVHDWSDADRPGIGKSMYIRGKGLHDWWITTPVVRVEMVDWEDSWLRWGR